MTLRLFIAALLISAIPLMSLAEAAGVSLNSGDFVSAREIHNDGETLVSCRLSKSGKAKFKKINKAYVYKKIHSEIAGVNSDFTLREEIRGDSLQLGPYSESEAHQIVDALNPK